MAQNNKTFSYIRVDASGRDIPGSNVLRQSMPKNGKWKQINAYACCNPFTLLTVTPAATALASTTFTLKCGATTVATVFMPGATVTTADIIAKLNAYASMYGAFSNSGAVVSLQLNQNIATGLCPVGTLTFTITV